MVVAGVFHAPGGAGSAGDRSSRRATRPQSLIRTDRLGAGLPVDRAWFHDSCLGHSGRPLQPQMDHHLDADLGQRGDRAGRGIGGVCHARAFLQCDLCQLRGPLRAVGLLAAGQFPQRDARGGDVGASVRAVHRCHDLRRDSGGHRGTVELALVVRGLRAFRRAAGLHCHLPAERRSA